MWSMDGFNWGISPPLESSEESEDELLVAASFPQRALCVVWICCEFSLFIPHVTQVIGLRWMVDNEWLRLLVQSHHLMIELLTREACHRRRNQSTTPATRLHQFQIFSSTFLPTWKKSNGTQAGDMHENNSIKTPKKDASKGIMRTRLEVKWWILKSLNKD